MSGVGEVVKLYQLSLYFFKGTSNMRSRGYVSFQGDKSILNSFFFWGFGLLEQPKNRPRLRWIHAKASSMSHPWWSHSSSASGLTSKKRWPTFQALQALVETWVEHPWDSIDFDRTMWVDNGNFFVFCTWGLGKKTFVGICVKLIHYEVTLANSNVF